MAIENLITDHLDLWSAAVRPKSSAGRGSNSKLELTGIKKLRELILELAVRGKLVPQDPSEEPTSVLLERIAAEKAQLVKEGQIKKPKALPEISEKEKPFELPSTWSWVRLNDIANYNGRPNVEPDNIKGDVWLLDLEDIEKNTSKLLYRASYEERESKSNKSIFKCGDVLYGKLRPYLNKVIVADLDGVCTTEIVPIVPSDGLHSAYLKYLLKSPAFQSYVNSLMYGVKMPRLGTEDAIKSIHPLPPFAEQHRIVAKVDELMALCDQLEQRSESQLMAHQTLVDALLEILIDSGDADELAQNWMRLNSHFDTLFTTETSIDALKRTILQLAVMGKLVSQDPDDEPASSLLERIAAEKVRLIKEEGLRTSANNFVEMGDKYISCPSHWEWIRLGNLARFIDYRGKTPPKKDSGIRLITAKNIRFGYVDLSPEEFISEQDYDKWMTRGFPKFGDVLFTTEAPLGNAAIVELQEPFALAQRAICFQWHECLISEFMLIQILARPFQNQLIDNSSGMTATGVKAARLKEIPMVVPPLAEQHRIVSKVDELMALCTKLKERLDISQHTQMKLAIAVVNELFGSQNKTELQQKDENVAMVFSTMLCITDSRIDETSPIAFLVKREGGKAEAKDIWKKTNLSLPEFYKQLKKEIEDEYIEMPSPAVVNNG